MKLAVIHPKFVEYVPKELEEGVLYICKQYNTASHKCACGCGEKVVTPLSPVEWQVRNENGLVSMSPSIGNWDYACHSHYWIRNNKIQWAGHLTADQIERTKRKDFADKVRYIDEVNRQRSSQSPAAVDAKSDRGDRSHTWRQIYRWLQRLFKG